MSVDQVPPTTVPLPKSRRESRQLQAVPDQPGLDQPVVPSPVTELPWDPPQSARRSLGAWLKDGLARLAKPAIPAFALGTAAVAVGAATSPSAGGFQAAKTSGTGAQEQVVDLTTAAAGSARVAFTPTAHQVLTQPQRPLTVSELPRLDWHAQLPEGVEWKPLRLVKGAAIVPADGQVVADPGAEALRFTSTDPADVQRARDHSEDGSTFERFAYDTETGALFGYSSFHAKAPEKSDRPAVPVSPALDRGNPDTFISFVG